MSYEKQTIPVRYDQKDETICLLFSYHGNLLSDVPTDTSHPIYQALNLQLENSVDANLLSDLIGYENFEKLRQASWNFGKPCSIPPCFIEHYGNWDISCYPTKLNDTASILVNFTPSSITTGTQLKNSFQIAADATGIGVWDIRFIDDPRSLTESECFTNLLDNHFIFFSQVAKQILGIEINKPITWRTIWDRIHPDDQVTFEQFFTANIFYDIRLNFDCRIADMQNQYKWYTIRGQTLTDQSGLLLRMSGSLIECTEQKEMIHSVVEAENTKKLALEASGIGVWTGNLDSGYWQWDNNVKRIMNIESASVGKLQDWTQYIHPDDFIELKKGLNQAIAELGQLSVEVRVKDKTRQYKYVHIKGNVTTDVISKVNRIDGICHDTTAHRIAEKRMSELNEALEKTVKKRTMELIQARDLAESGSMAKSNFLAMMSHEIRTPMNGVIGALDLVENTPLNAEQNDLIETAKTSALNLVDILNDILDLNKIEAGKMELEFIPVSISATVDNVINMFTAISESKNVELRLEEDNALPDWVNTDPVRLRQILINFISNAVKFSSTNNEKKGIVSVTAKVDQQHSLGQQKSIVFTVSDNGIGMDKKTVERLFTPFTQAEASTTRKYGGTGLGLAICARLCEMLGGQIEVQSEVGEGSTFTIRLPLWETSHDSDLSAIFGVNVAIIGALEENKVQWLKTRLEQLNADVSIVSNITNDTLSDYEMIILLATGQNESEIDKELSDLPVTEAQKIVLVCPRQFKQSLWAKHPSIQILANNPLTRYSLEKINMKDTQVITENTPHHTEKIVNKAVDKTPIAENLTNSPSTILLVEDNPLNQKLLLKQLSVIGYSADVASDGEIGLQLFSENQYKIVFTDCHMPKMDGYTLSKNIRAFEKEHNTAPVPIIAITGAAMTGDKEKCIESGMSDFLSKPIETHKLKEMVEKWHERNSDL
ncbi:ATP-binding protein [Catenovulum sediminis]|uniref:histidine kinase n=1 Tax=Catenovulum sediminis TaxID=1740262 RepID=A0ABV1RGI6_9ALTE|nr:ATP-binding protein [Catenovulum sediminis]